MMARGQPQTSFSLCRCRCLVWWAAAYGLGLGSGAAWGQSAAFPLSQVLSTGGAASAGEAAVGRMELAWPTPHKGWAEGRPFSEYLQHAGSGDPRSGGYGGVRGSGAQFHEGIDIKCLSRDRRGEPLDPILAAMSGVVRHISTSPGKSSYGRYIVLEHPEVTPAVFTLYAHLARIAPGLQIGARVTRGQAIGTMGYSAGGYTIPKARAHLHFEIGLVVTRDFQGWYDRQKFGSRNEHGMWNGMNMLGLDPLAFFDAWRAGGINTPWDFISSRPAAVRVQVATRRVPDFITRYPALLTKPRPVGLVAGWEIRFDWTGLPFAWTQLGASEVAGLPLDRPRVVEVNETVNRREQSRRLAVSRRGVWSAGRDLEIVLGQLFGWR